MSGLTSKLPCVQYIETDLQRLQMKLKVEPRHMHEAIEAEYAAAAKAKPVRRPLELDPSAKPGAKAVVSAHPPKSSTYFQRSSLRAASGDVSLHARSQDP